jgi:hypothetical protein
MIEKFKKESKELRQEVREKTLGYVVAALGLVAGLAWNEAVRALIDSFFKTTQNSLTAKFTYAVLITIIIVVISTYLVRLSISKKE